MTASAGPAEGATTDAPSFRMAFREWFGLTRLEAEILAVLYAAQGEFVATPVLMDHTGRGRGHIFVCIHRIREALEAEALDSVLKRGYRLTEIGLEECRAALRRVGEELRTAG